MDHGDDPILWQRQLIALKIAARMNQNAIDTVRGQLEKHPEEKIRNWIKARFAQIRQDVISLEPSGYELVLIKGGIFSMGSEEHETEQPVHEVTLQDFYIGRYPVTNEEYGHFLAATGYEEPEYWGNREFNQPRQPVVGVSWHDALKYAQWAGLQLPSEAQWEYACRAGTTTRYAWGDDPDCAMANYGGSDWADECKGKNPGKTSVVGNYPPNPWGLYDMHGNVYEWCQDHWHDSYKGAHEDGRPWEDRGEGTFRVLRGGAWFFPAGYCRSAYRRWGDPFARSRAVGFRLVCLPGQPGEPGKPVE
ncbi:hypothetical protein DSCO28_24520 [Desulfosarcina ovata subsp. sediminis]|uniref:Sulfatase-modifying factor enzyme-like domain-containing protein n=1 Tax=Desulfosarcina ovata subsp. sediminis TaxID=885957 RepID=A0A5K7ZLE2_9BACT|nr:formylglycine-generating enzyme family protein [Desulfosarcina ovata]BBO81886.1 hypothetical protein DSCO28_24520 [Desulfosarcina ovata subsp. sediminis]